MYQRILAPVDGSDCSERSLREAIALAADQRAHLHLVHVISDAYLNAVLTAGLYSGDLLRQLRLHGEGILNAAGGAAADRGVAADTHLIEHRGTEIGEAIVAEARSWSADLIVMGTHGRRGIARAIIGSDAEYVARNSPVPVLLTRV